MQVSGDLTACFAWPALLEVDNSDIDDLVDPDKRFFYIEYQTSHECGPERWQNELALIHFAGLFRGWVHECVKSTGAEWALME